MTKFLTICILFVLIFWSRLSFAGGFFYLLEDGTPYSWENPTNIPIHPEDGSCGRYSNTDMIDMIEGVLANWTDIIDVNLGFAITEGQIGEIDDSNYDAAFYGETNDADNIYTPYNSIIFDDDGAIHTTEKNINCEDLGQSLGTTTITDKDEDTGLITRAAFVLNCACFRDADPILCDTDGDGTDEFDPCDNSGVDYTDNVMRAIFQHEMGHFLNLDHTPLYENLFDDLDTDNDDFVPLMYPFLNNPNRDISPKQDDIMALATMYPAANLDDSYCTVTGTLIDQAANELQCATISAIHLDKSESISFITGATAPGQILNGDNDRVDYNSTEQAFESTSARGFFTLRLKPDESYQITANAINTAFTDSAQVMPCRNDQHEECTDEILALCNDEDEATECEPCVANEILLTTAEYNSLYRDACTPGATVELGVLSADNTDSISLETSLNLNGTETVDGDDDDTAASSGGCQLFWQTNSTLEWPTLLGIFQAFTTLVILKWRKRSEFEI